jgi:hypothetical protein
MLVIRDYVRSMQDIEWMTGCKWTAFYSRGGRGCAVAALPAVKRVVPWRADADVSHDEEKGALAS